VKVRYFASARGLAQRDSETVSISKGSTVGALVEEIAKLHPRLGSLGRSTRYSVNLEVVDGGETLRDGDEVGVLPPVAGG
jgi:molybdopterin converting factor subunit 1